MTDPVTLPKADAELMHDCLLIHLSSIPSGTEKHEALLAAYGRVREILSRAGEGEPSDTSRLDWLEEHGDITNLRFQRGYPTMDNSSPPCWRFWCSTEGSTTRPTVREALDTAMKEARTPP